MNVLWVSHFVPWPPRGGNLQRSWHLLRELSREARVDLIAFHRRRSEADRDLDGAKREMEKLCGRVSIFPIPNERSRAAFAAGLLRNLLEKSPYTVQELYSDDFRDRLERYLGDGGYDAVHFDTVDLAGHRPLAAGLPAILNHHNVESLLFRRRAPRERNPLAGAYLRLQASKLGLYEKRWYGAFDRNLFVSAADRSRAESDAPGLRADVVPNGTDTAYYTPGGEGEAKRVVWVGGLSWFPNRDAVAWLLGRLWPRIRQRHPDATLDLIGSAPERFLPRGGADRSVRVHGFVEDLRPLVTGAWLSVAPLRVGGGTRLKILDALAMGKTVLATSVGREGIEAREGEEIVTADGEDAFVEEADRLLRDRDLRERIGKNGRALAERVYDWSVVGAGYRRIVRDLTRGKEE
ncbi:MAG: glycosyltransferase [Candidatus Eisenbacteria bacterium]|nr:glycosyltransferase [Candidatus Eisenbacteria bacterium]